LPTMGALVLIIYLGVLIWSRPDVAKTRRVQTINDGNDLLPAKPTMTHVRPLRKSAPAPSPSTEHP